MKTILVTGSCGFIGSNLLKSLKQKYLNFQIYHIDDLSSGDWRNLKTADNYFHFCDISNTEDLVKTGITDIAFDCIIHLASNTDTTDNDPYRQIGRNINGWRNILSMASNNPRCKLVVALSASSYGKSKAEACKETDPLNADSPYAMSKLFIEKELLRFIEDFPQFKYYGIKIFNAYGFGESHKGKMASYLSQMINQICDNSEVNLYENTFDSRRDWVHVDDVVDLICYLLGEDCPSGVYNCGSGRAVSFSYLIDRICYSLSLENQPLVKFIGRKPSHFQDYTCANLTKVNSIGWTPKISVEEGIYRYVRELCH